MPHQSADEKKPRTVVGNIAALVGFYAIFVYLAGWTFFDYYFRTFGLYTRWIDISIPETLMKGFVILFEGGGLLWPIYLFVLLVPVLFEVFPKLQKHTISQIVFAVLLLACLPLTYLISRSVGLRTAKNNQGSTTELPFIRFAGKCGNFSGRLLYVKEGVFYIHDLKTDPQSPPGEPCLGPSTPQGDLHFLTVYRAEDVHALEILEK